MVGALLGDLAAWTWDKDRDLFYSRLVDSEAMPSVYGHALLQAACSYLMPDAGVDDRLPGGTEGLEQDGQCVMRWIVETWMEGPDKGEQTVAGLVSTLIDELRKGATKSEAFHSVPFFRGLFKEEHRPDSVIYYVCRAWDSFYHGFDFTSSIHNAMKWSGDRHLLAAITGSFAGAMYGCRSNLIKKKYRKDGPALTCFDLKATKQGAGYPPDLIYEMWRITDDKRLFYPKNNACTNVEWHRWRECQNLFSDIGFTEEQHRKIMLSAVPGWECRFGFYLDDGWHYIYRSGVLISRFKMEMHRSSWWITHWQLSGERTFEDSIQAFDCALGDGCRVYKTRIHELAYYVSECRFFNGEMSIPPDLGDTVEGRFWYGEMRFVTSFQDYGEWKDLAEKVRQSLSGSKRRKFERYTEGQRAILCYIEMHYSKWRPYDDMNWIFKYPWGLDFT